MDAGDSAPGMNFDRIATTLNAVGTDSPSFKFSSGFPVVQNRNRKGRILSRFTAPALQYHNFSILGYAFWGSGADLRLQQHGGSDMAGKNEGPSTAKS